MNMSAAFVQRTAESAGDIIIVVGIEEHGMASPRIILANNNTKSTEDAWNTWCCHDANIYGCFEKLFERRKKKRNVSVLI